MPVSDWISQAHSSRYTAAEVIALSKDIANRLEHQGGKKTKKPLGFAAKTKDELIKLAKARKIKVAASWTKDKIVEALRKKH